MCRTRAAENQAKKIPMPRISTGAVHVGEELQNHFEINPWKDQKSRKGQVAFFKIKPLGICLCYNLSQTCPLDQLPHWGGHIQKICKNMTTTEKIVQSCLNYSSTPNVLFECFIFPSVTSHINVWYWKTGENYGMLPIFILHSHFSSFIFLPQMKTNSLTTEMQF